MMSETGSGKNCLVVGAGALGLVLAKALMASRKGDSLSHKVAVFNRSAVPSTFLFSEPLTLASESQWSVEVFTGSPKKCFESVQPATLFFCVPPEVTASVFDEWMDVVEDQRGDRRPIEVVLCNNGCLPPRTLRRIAAVSGAVQFIRALFFVGAMRFLPVPEMRVQWTGGHSVLWGRIPSTPSSVQPSFWLEQGLSAEEHQLDFLNWQFAPDILTAERKKFFTNFILAAGIGPRLAKNRTLPEHLPEPLLTLLSEQFAILWHSFALGEDALKETLHMTVKATGENINSLSLAGAQGNKATMQWFIASLRSELNVSSEKARLNPLHKFLDSVQLAWGESNEH
jgi:hypothetical protein